MRKSKITIVTPSFNQAKYIEDTICSVLSQNYQNLEYIILDGCSNDASVDVIKQYESSLNYWVSEADHGQSHAINKGLKRASGSIINWLNSDDYYEPHALKIVSDQFTPDLTGLGGKSRLFNSKGTLSRSRGTDVFLGNQSKTIGWARIDQPETFFSKEAWDKVGLLNEHLHYCMDREWWMRYLYEFGIDSFKRIDDTLVNFRIHDDSKTQTSQPGFLKEHHSLYYAMANVIEHTKAMRFMEKHLTLDRQLETAISSWGDSELVRNSFNYYLLKSAHENYALENYILAKGFLALVRNEWLAPEDRKLHRKLTFRMKLPLSIIKVFKK
jgi:glycosyltransferase involved in cell wall biosynthesis